MKEGPKVGSRKTIIHIPSTTGTTDPTVYEQVIVTPKERLSEHDYKLMTDHNPPQEPFTCPSTRPGDRAVLDYILHQYQAGVTWGKYKK